MNVLHDVLLIKVLYNTYYAETQLRDQRYIPVGPIIS